MIFSQISALLEAAGNTVAAADGSGMSSNLMLIVVMVGMLVIMYFFMIRPNQKKEKEAKEMRSSLEVGDEVTTIGGIVGRVVSIKEDTIVLETAGERSRIRFLRGAVDKVNKLVLDASASSAASASSTKEKAKDKAKDKSKD